MYVCMFVCMVMKKYNALPYIMYGTDEIRSHQTCICIHYYIHYLIIVYMTVFIQKINFIHFLCL